MSAIIIEAVEEKSSAVQKKTVVVVEDDAGLRQQLIKLLDHEKDLQCVGAYPTGEDALRDIPVRKPDVVLMDINLPGMSGIECVAELKKKLPTVQIVILTIYEDSERLFRALKAGANGYLLKSSPPEEILAAIHDVHIGGSPMSTHIARKVVQHFQAEGRQTTGEADNLSAREDEIMRLLASGFIYKEVGDKLGIAMETVRSHVKNVCKKMHVRNRVEAVAKRRMQ